MQLFIAQHELDECLQTAAGKLNGLASKCIESLPIAGLKQRAHKLAQPGLIVQMLRGLEHVEPIN